MLYKFGTITFLFINLNMRKSIFLLLMMTFTLIASVSTSAVAKAPPDIGPTIKTEYTTPNQMVIVYAPVMDAIVYETVKAVEFTNTGFESVFKLDADCSPTLNWSTANINIDSGPFVDLHFIFSSFAKTGFKYTEGRATEYRCNGHI